MTNKEQIIIDGVDVSKCDCLGYGSVPNKPHYRPCTAVRYLYALGADDCHDFPDCSYKKAMKELTRKTTECEELKESVDKIKNYVKNQMFDVDCENWFDCFIYTFEDLKKQLDKQAKDASNRYSELNREWNNRCKKYADDLKSLNRYRKALDEIEGLATNLRTRTDYHSEDEVNADIDNVLNIISKAKGEE